MAKDQNIIKALVRKIIQQPYNTINFNKMLFGDHKPMVPRDVWILSQIELLKEIGPMAYFEGLLEALEHPITNDEFNSVPEEEMKKAIKKKNDGVISPYFHKE